MPHDDSLFSHSSLYARFTARTHARTHARTRCGAQSCAMVCLMLLGIRWAQAIDTFIDAANVGQPNGLLSTAGNKVSCVKEEDSTPPCVCACVRACVFVCVVHPQRGRSHKDLASSYCLSFPTATPRPLEYPNPNKQTNKRTGLAKVCVA